MNIECPKCKHEQDVTDHLPDSACDSYEYECKKCSHEFLIGWHATAEIRPGNKPTYHR